MKAFLHKIKLGLKKLTGFFIYHEPPMETPEKKETTAEAIVENISHTANQNVKNVVASFKKIGNGFKRLFIAIYILGLGAILFILLYRYGLVVTFTTYLGAFTISYWLLVALFVWVRDGFINRKER